MRSLIGVLAKRCVGTLSLLGLTWAYACSNSPRDFADDDGSAAGEPASVGGTNAGGSAGGDASPLGGSHSGGSDLGGGGSGGEPGTPPGPCAETPCLHDGQCSAVGDTFSCDCAGTGYAGDTCEQDVDECEAAPCQNGGTCENTDGSYTCECDAAHTGKDCELLRIEPLPSSFIPIDISPEGSVVVGKTDDRASKYVAGEEVFLGTYLGDAHSAAFATNAGGTVVVGASGTGYPLTDTSRAVIWTGSSIEQLPMPAGYTRCEATDVSADGRVIAGTCDYKLVRWVDEELEELGVAEGVESCRDAVISDDGSTIGGLCSIYPSNRAFVWTEDSGFQLLVSLPVASGCVVLGLSADGSAATGSCSSGGSFTAAYYWTTEDGPRELMRAPQTSVAAGHAISGSGLRVVGSNGEEAAVWDDANGASSSLRELLPSTSELDEWHLTGAPAISADGKTIVVSRSLDQTKGHFIARFD